MKKASTFLVASIFALTSQAAFAQSTRNIGPSPNNIAPAPGPVYGQSCPPGYITQITQDQWGRTVAVNCVPQQGGRPGIPVEGIIGGIIGGIISGGNHGNDHRHRHCHGGINCHTHSHIRGHH